MKQTLQFIIFGVMLIGCGGCITRPQANPSDWLTKLDTKDIAEEYHRRLNLLWQRKPPDLPTLDNISKEERAEKIFRPLIDYQDRFDQYAFDTISEHKIFSDAGDSSSTGVMALAYWEGYKDQFPTDKCKALTLAYQAAQADPVAGAPVLAKAYYSGIGVQQDRKRAYFWTKELWHRSPEHRWGRAEKELILPSVEPALREEWDKEWINWHPTIDAALEMEKPCIATDKRRDAR